MSYPCKRKETDLTKLMKSGFKVEMIDDRIQSFFVEFHGPENSPYHGGVWRVRVDLPHSYPQDPPFICFENNIFHPNISSSFGAICLDVLKREAWNPDYDLVTVFEFFIPLLLWEPNPEDPLDPEAAILMMKDPEAYYKKVKEYCVEYAGAKPDEASGEEQVNEDDESAAALSST